MMTKTMLRAVGLRSFPLALLILAGGCGGSGGNLELLPLGPGDRLAYSSITKMTDSGMDSRNRYEIKANDDESLRLIETYAVTYRQQSEEREMDNFIIDLYGRVKELGDPEQKAAGRLSSQIAGKHIKLWLPENKRVIGEKFHIIRFPQPHEVKEQKQWEGWDVLVVSYGGTWQKYYDVKTGFLVGEKSDGNIMKLVEKKVSAGGL